MKAKDFDAIVIERANERVQKKINTFRETIRKALTALGGRMLLDLHAVTQITEQGCRALDQAKVSRSQEWPLDLWRVEQDVVREELLGTMDEMGRALAAASKPRDPNEEGCEEAPNEG